MLGSTRFALCPISIIWVNHEGFDKIGECNRNQSINRSLQGFSNSTEKLNEYEIEVFVCVNY